MSLDNRWHKSSKSAQGGNCVRARLAPGTGGTAVQIGDTKDPDGTPLTVDATAFAAFTRAVKTGELTR